MKNRGFLLITVLLITLILFTMGLAFLGSRSSLYKAAQEASLSAQARALARSGLEDARVKLNKDLLYPPKGGAGQVTYSYSEVVYQGARRIGSYRVMVDQTYVAPPYSVLKITSTGFVGGPPPAASHTYTAYLDLANTSPTYYQFVRWEGQ